MSVTHPMHRTAMNLHHEVVVVSSTAEELADALNIIAIEKDDPDGRVSIFLNELQLELLVKALRHYVHTGAVWNREESMP